MVTKEQKKEFALSQLAPYLADPSTCGYDTEKKNCEYITPDGRMCVAGKNMLDPTQENIWGNIEDILSANNEEQEGIFKPEVVGILSNEDWQDMQSVHDLIALHPTDIDELKTRIDRLGLFSYEELVERAESLKKV